MYLRSNRDMRIPRNYSGNAFSDRTSIPTPAKDMTRPKTHYAAPEKPSDVIEVPPSGAPYEQSTEECSECDKGAPTSTPVQKSSPVLSPFGELGSEELLLIALALIIFQNGKDPDLALILLALLFVS